MGCAAGACGPGGSCGSTGGCASGGSCGTAGCGSRSRAGTPRNIVGVIFHNTAKTYYLDASGLTLREGEHVVVEADHGERFGTVAQASGPSRKFAGARGLPKVLRRATGRDISVDRENRQREKKAFDFCQGRIRKNRLEMKLVYVEEAFDRQKLTFYFTAEGRVDFRELVRELAQQFHSRIEMRQIGPRDEAKVLGGYGDCGRPLCCTTFLREFAPISIRMARRQGLSLNPSKISGRCGRLKCCLKYEDTGEDLRKTGALSPPSGGDAPREANA
ncbi:MAG: stage 0 sporulation family protein [Acidobacteriota bacterium]